MMLLLRGIQDQNEFFNISANGNVNGRKLMQIKCNYKLKEHYGERGREREEMPRRDYKSRQKPRMKRRGF